MCGYLNLQVSAHGVVAVLDSWRMVLHVRMSAGRFMTAARWLRSVRRPTSDCQAVRQLFQLRWCFVARLLMPGGEHYRLSDSNDLHGAGQYAVTDLLPARHETVYGCHL